MQINPGEPHRVGVPHDVDERDATGPALHRVHPISGPRISGSVRIAAVPDVETVERVKSDRNPDAEQFQEENEWEIRQKTNLARVRRWSADRGRIRDQNMLEQKRTDRNNAGQRMQSAQDERYPLTST